MKNPVFAIFVNKKRYWHKIADALRAIEGGCIEPRNPPPHPTNTTTTTPPPKPHIFSVIFPLTMLDADLVVVGGGPAGSSAAKAAKREDPDARVILLEKRAKPHGTCAGGLGRHWVQSMGISVPEHLKSAPINEVAIYGPTEKAMIHADEIGLPTLGWVVDRPRFDDWMLKCAEAEGAWVMRETHFREIDRDNGSWTITAENEDGKFEIATPYVVDASGPKPVVAEQLGMEIDRNPENIHTAFQKTVPLPEDKPWDRIELWFKAEREHEGDYAIPSGYAWSFPSTNQYWDYGNPHTRGEYTRVGAGVSMEVNKDSENRIKKVVEDFQRNFPEFDGETLSENGGLIPTGQPYENAYNGVFLAGDAGRVTSPIHGGGMWWGAVSGAEAAKTAIQGGDDKDYEKAWKDRIGFYHKAHFMMKRALQELNNDEIDLIVSELDDFEPQSINPVNEITRASKVLIQHPKLGKKSAVAALKGLIASR